MAPLLVLYGSQTGTAQEAAERVARDAERRQFAPVRCVAMDSYERVQLVNEALVVFVVATTGDGDPPDNMKQFWRFLLRKGLPADTLASVGFAVFGLGDSSYAKYNFVAKKLRNRLVQLGAQEVAARGFGDDQSENGCEANMDRWLEQTLWPALLARHPLPDGFVVDNSPRLFKPRHTAVTPLPPPPPPSQSAESVSTVPLDARRMAVLERAPPLGSYLKTPSCAELVVNKRITAASWEQDVRHIELRVPDCPAYAAGDIAVVYPRNEVPEAQLRGLAARLGVDLDVPLGGLQLKHAPESASLRELLCYFLDALGSPRRGFFEALSFFAADEEEKEKLEEFCAPEGSDLFHSYSKKEHKTYLDVFEDFRSVKPPLEYLVEMIPALQPREYSISSARGAHGDDRVHLTVALVDFLTPWGRRKRGVASTWWAGLEPGSRMPLFIKRGTLRAPESPEVPLVLIGPGTGVAPMRALLYERGSENSHLYFGCRSEAQDYYYADEWKQLQGDGRLGRLRVAFSRDQPGRKVYVQSLIAEDGALLADWMLRKEGLCFISGSAKRMPTEVREALVKAFEAHGPLSAEAAAKAVRQMELRGRLRIESWS